MTRAWLGATMAIGIAEAMTDLEALLQTFPEGERMQLQSAALAWKAEAIDARKKLLRDVKANSDERVFAIRKYLITYFSSEKRLAGMIDILHNEVPEIFWPVFLRNWSICDDAWLSRTRLLSVLRRVQRRKSAEKFLDPQAASFLRIMPRQIECYRGCSLQRIRGLSWTTEKKIAEKFARGHRHIRVPNAVVAKAIVPKSAVFFASMDRGEHELIVDPKWITEIHTVPYGLTS